MTLRISKDDAARAWRIIAAEKDGPTAPLPPPDWRFQNGRLVLLTAAGISPKIQKAMEETYGSNLGHILESDPFRLYHDHQGVSFESALFIDRRNTEQNPQRTLRAALHAAMLKEAGDDKVFYEHRAIIDRAETMIGIPRIEIERGWEVAEKRNEAICFSMNSIAFGALRRHVNEERELASNVRNLNRPIAWSGTPAEIRQALHEAGCQREDPSQSAAVAMSMQNQTCVITGSAGSGKSSILKAINALLLKEPVRPRIFCVAVAAKVARALSEKTGIDGSTIHRFLEADEQGAFHLDATNKADVDVLIVEEAFMIPNPLLLALMRSLRSHCRVIFVGDEGQLEPIGRGWPLQAISLSGSLPISRLTSNHRSREGSMIPESGRRVLRGLPPIYRDDMSHVPTLTDVQTLDSLRACWTKAVETHGEDNVQILTPLRDYRFGSMSLSTFLAGRQHFVIGDRVMNLKNDAEKNFNNGEIGRVVEIGQKGMTVVTEEGTVVDYARTNPATLTLAIASTLHKSQGLEFPVVINVMHPSADRMTDRRMINMAITRAKTLCVNIDQRGQIMRTISKRVGGKRNTLLTHMLKGSDPTKTR